MNSTTILTKKIDFLKRLLENGGPSPNDYTTLNEWYNSVWQLFEKGQFSSQDIDLLRSAYSQVYENPQTMYGLTYMAPYGYQGDFEIIDKIYQKYICSDNHLANWDHYFQSLAASKAVRNRKAYFKNLLHTKMKTYDTLEVLNLASGPCRDLKEFYEESPCGDKVMFDCVEFDPRAINYAKHLLPHQLQVNFIQQNIFKFTPTKKYDLIWSAGLFDYFNDKTFMRILHRIAVYTKANGEVIIGNFHPRNPNKNCMEFTNWQLHHRTEKDLEKLAKKAGIANQRQITIESEPAGVNLFMRIQQ